MTDEVGVQNPSRFKRSQGTSIQFLILSPRHLFRLCRHCAKLAKCYRMRRDDVTHFQGPTPIMILR